MLIKKWDGKSWWDELEELAKLLDGPEGIETDWAAKVLVLHNLRATIFVVLDERVPECIGYFALKDCKDHAFVYDFVVKPTHSMLTTRISKKVIKFIESLGFDTIKGQVRVGNTSADRLYEWLGFEKTHYLVTLKIGDAHCMSGTNADRLQS